MAYPNPLNPPSGRALRPRCPQAMPQCRTTAPRPLTSANGPVECHLCDRTAIQAA